MKQPMHDNSLANGTSSIVEDMTCTNNTSVSDNELCNAASNVSSRSTSAAVTTLGSSSAGSNSLISTSMNQNIPLSTSSGINVGGTNVSTSAEATRSSETASASVDSNGSASIDQHRT